MNGFLKSFLIFLVLFTDGALFAQTDTEFWFAAPEITYEFVTPSPQVGTERDRPVALHFSTFETSASVTIDQPANPAFIPIVQTILPGIPTTINLTPFIDFIENKPANTILNYGIRIRADKPIAAYYSIDCPTNAATYTLLGRNGLGYSFLIPSQFHYDNYAYTSPVARNSFDVVAINDSTTITIVPAKAITGHAAGDTFSIVLNRGETWEGRAVSGLASEHLGGTKVWANKPIAVTISDDAVYVPISDVSVDLAGDQLIPTELCGTQYFHAGGLSILPSANRIYVYALDNSTSIDTNGSYAITINKGEFYEFLRNYDNGEGYACGFIQTNKNAMVYSFSGRGNSNYSQEGSCIVPPENCSGNRKVSISHSSLTSGSEYTFTLITRNGNQGSFTISGFPPIPISPGLFQLVPGTSGEWVYQGFSVSNFGWPNGMSRIISNSSGPFITATNDSDLQNSAQVAYVTDFSSLNLGPDMSICPGDSIILDAGYGKPSYLWSTGATTQTITVKHNGTYWVTVQETACTLSDTINVSYWQLTPVSLGSDKLLCQGDSVLLNAGTGYSSYTWSNGGTTQSIYAKQPGEYWVKAKQFDCFVYDTVMVTLVQGINAGPDRSMCPGDSVLIDAGPGMTTYLWNNGATTQSTWATISGTYTVTATAQSCIFSDNVQVTYLSIPEVHIGPDTTICIGQTITFDAGACNGCTYQWSNLATGQMNIGTGLTYTATTSGIYMATVTGINGCKGRDTATVSIGQPLTIGVSIAASVNPVCAGTPVTFTATPVNPGSSPAYQWRINAVNAINANNAVFTYVPSNGDVVTCELTSSLSSCISTNPVTSNAIVMTVEPMLPVSVSVSSSANIVCEGTAVTLTATPSNGGSSPAYQWKVNGVNAINANNAVFTYVPSNGDVVTCFLTSTFTTCTTNNPATSAPVPMTVNPNLPVGITIAPSSNPFCQGNPVTFTATPGNGGSSPAYQWKVNAVNASNANNAVYTYVPSNGDVVTCEVTSSEPCPTGNPATSSPVTMIVNTGLPAGVSIAASANPFCEGTTVTYSATPVNGGSAPSYQWRVNAVNAINANNAVFSFSPLPGDEVSCVVTSNLNCVTANPATSNIITMVAAIKPSVTFTPCNDLITTLNAKPFKLRGGTPIGGVYSGPGVTSATGIFNPASAGTGIKTIQYSYTNVVTCSDFKTITITVQPAPAFICGNALTDIRDGRQYTTFSLPNGKCWTAENLDFGITIDDLTPQTDNCIPEKYTRPASRVPRPAFYQWDELMAYQTTATSQGLCPPGWHVPTSAEWNELLSYYNGAGQAAGPMKDTLLVNGFQSWQQGFLYLNNTWAFTTGLYAGSMYWSSTLSGSSNPSGSRAIARGLNEYNPSVSKYEALRGNGFGVRCCRD